MLSSLAVMAALASHPKVTGSVGVELTPTVTAQVHYGDLTGAHSDVAEHGTRLIRQMWTEACAQNGGYAEGAYTASLMITETQVGLYCLGHIAGRSWEVWLRCSTDGTFHVDNTDVPDIRRP